MPSPSFDRYYRYDELTDLLHAYAREYPGLVAIESIGRSFEGREIWGLTITNIETGPAGDKPALWIDGNIHATEVSPSSACLYFIDRLVRTYGSDPDVTRCLDTRAFYVCPRVNPDGAEWALADRPKLIRSSTRPYPYDEEPVEGLREEDVDGDGRMLMMRIPDPNGAWKASPEEPRLLVRRAPTESGGAYYRILPEGTFERFDGVTMTVQPKRERLDLNRNFPSGWRTEGEQAGAGPFPTSESEVRTVVAFVSNHPNITGGITFHTFSGVLLRPYSSKPDDEFAAEDLWTYQKIGERGTDLTGYPNVSVFHDFKYHPKEVITGAFDDWLFEHLGVFAWTVEIWSPQRQAGIEKYPFIDWYREHPFEDDLRMLRWSDEELAGRGYIDWYPFEHPQLGPIELGGWDVQYAFRNPPPHLLETELERFPEWLVWHALISPKLELHSLDVRAIGDGHHRVRLTVHNTGWLPSYVTKRALAAKAVRGVVAEITLPGGAELVAGKAREERGQLEGRAYKGAAPGVFGAVDPTTDRATFEWTVRAPNGDAAHVTVRHERAGVVRVDVPLE